MSDENPQPVQCSNKDCHIAEGGKCVEGLPPADCPNYGKPLLASDEAEAGSADAEVDGVKLPRADKLTADEVVRLFKRDDCKVVAIVAPYNTGKTSLIASLYDLFQSGPVGSVQFAGSDTLHAFELACHDSRAASERGVPHTERTHRGEVKFYNLSLFDSKTGERSNLILADRAGEDYEDAADDVSLTSEFIEVSRADTVTVLLDGARLADNLTRHDTRNDLKMLTQAIVDGGIVSRRQRLAVVLTKLDAAKDSPHSERIEADLQNDVTKLKELFSDHFASIEIFRVAAYPKGNTVERGNGVPELLNYWLLEPEIEASIQVQPAPGSRVFGRLKAITS